MSTGRSATSQESVQNAKKKLTRFLRTLDRVPTDILRKEAPKLYAEIISEIPYDSGKLERSVRVSVSQDLQRPGLHASASAHSKSGYNYAGIQHENEDYHHTKPGAKDHFISDPFERCTERIMQQMRERIVLED